MRKNKMKLLLGTVFNRFCCFSCTIWSIVNRSPHQLIREIILVDDLSTDPKLKQPLDAFVKNLPVNVKIIRTNKREGLIRARLIGARAAKVSHNFIQLF